ncbi:MAG: ABC transporter permease [Anaerolineae bacterium]|nr:ABC transporter permease [Anaerolineae bacterium]
MAVRSEERPQRRPMKLPFWLQRLLLSKELGLLLLLAAVVAFFYNQVEAAQQTRVYFDVAREVSPNVIAMIGVAMLILAGEFDLSVGSMLAVSGVTTVSVFNATDSMYAGIAAGLATGPLVGSIHGYLVTVVGMNSLVTTLGSMFALRGLVYVYTNQTPVVDENRFRLFEVLYHDELHTWLCRVGLFGEESSVCARVVGAAARNLPWWKQVPLPAMIALLLVLFFTFIMTQTEFGRRVYAIGGNATAARVSGIKVARTKFLLFVNSSTLAAFAGVMLAAQTGSGYFDAGSTGFELLVIAATVLGGVSLAGGQGNLIGALLGVLILGMTSKGMRLMALNTNYQLIVIGVVMLAAVFMHDFRRRLDDLRKRWER